MTDTKIHRWLVSRLGTRRFVALAGCCFAVGLIATGWLLPVRFSIHSHPSWAFDLSDPAIVVENTDSVFVGRVESDLSNRDGNPQTTEFKVVVLEVLRGDLSVGDDVVVSQTAFRMAGSNVVVEAADRHLLTVGRQYLFATTEQNGVNVLLGGPLSGQEVNPDLANDPLVATFRAETEPLPAA